MTNEIQIPSKWIYVFRSIFTHLTKRLPARVLKIRYPVARCRDSVHVFRGSIGPHVYINDGRPSKILSIYKIVIINTLPFPITLEYLNLDINIESLRWISKKQITLQDEIAPFGGKKEVDIDHDLTDPQANAIRDYPSRNNPCQCPTLKYEGSARIRSPLGNFDKDFTIETRALVFRG